MASTLKLEIVTPEAVAYSEDVDMVVLPGAEGELGIYPMHVPLMTQIVPGEVLVRKGAQESLLAVGEGFAEITAHRVSILTDMAVKAEGIDEAAVEDARRRAEARRSEKLSDEESARVEAAVARAAAQLKVKRHKRSS
jgi:F-type H+-transporting ATPase subunit epsilon